MPHDVHCSDLHQCKICGGDAESERGELVQCRRCPCAYHTGKCMPKKIANPGKNAKGLLQQRLWLGKRDDQGEHFVTVHSLGCDQDEYSLASHVTGQVIGR